MKEILLKQKQVLLFIFAGALSAVVEIGSFKILSVNLPLIFSHENNFHGIHFPLSNIFSTCCGILTNYFLSIWFVFERGKHSKRKEFAYFMSVSFVSTILSLVIFQIFFRFVFINHFNLGFFVFSQEMLSKISAILLVSVLNYSVKKKVIFNGWSMKSNGWWMLGVGCFLKRENRWSFSPDSSGILFSADFGSSISKINDAP